MDDLEFVQRCIKGDKPSWDEFVDRYSRLIYNYIYSTLKIKGFSQASHQNINDLFQDVFLSLIKDDFKKLKSYKAKNGCSLATWLRQITVNQTLDYIRRLRPATSLDQEDDRGLSLKDTLADPSEKFTDNLYLKETLEYLKDCMEQLSLDDKYFLELYVNQYLELEQLKEVLGISRGAVDMRKARITERLRDCFKGKGVLLDL